jgi:hypothetical protein
MTLHDHHFTSARASGRTIVEALGGIWRNDGGMCRCPAHGDRTPSLSVRLGQTRLLFHCFAGCETRAILDALRALHLAGSVSWTPIEVDRGVDDSGRKAAQRLWSESRAGEGSPVGRYLAARALAPTSALRFHPRTPLGRRPLTRFAPAMLASVTDGTGLIAIHRSFLSRDGCGLTSIEPRRAALGRLGAGLVRLAPAARRLGLAEGIETALSAIRLFDMPCWATLGTERFSRIDLPPSVEQIVLFLDHDAGGRRAEMLARARFGARVFEAHYPPCAGDDWNDVLRR